MSAAVEPFTDAERKAFIAAMRDKLMSGLENSQELRAYLGAISPDLPLPSDATGRWVRSGWRVNWDKLWWFRNVYRWQPFGGGS